MYCTYTVFLHVSAIRVYVRKLRSLLIEIANNNSPDTARWSGGFWTTGAAAGAGSAACFLPRFAGGGEVAEAVAGAAGAARLRPPRWVAGAFAFGEVVCLGAAFFGVFAVARTGAFLETFAAIGFLLNFVERAPDPLGVDFAIFDWAEFFDVVACDLPRLPTPAK